ncbi:DUF3102 domain-containing protein [Agrobacterium sp. 10MFCol1.1]|uniref:DUF3102 domain-containing protein n=1 Tax=Agrobacterium sp. 10MFCol1.1 TaxID=1150775 RepID=UPI0003A0B7DD|nr:DUF3102 domain-containing protein [Agrobacterium sp. 10MFCol1.1]
MITEIEVEGIGTMRHMNAFQMRRALRIADRKNRAIAMAAFGIGLTVQDFKKLSADQQRLIWDAHNRLTAPGAGAPSSPDDGTGGKPPREWQRLSEAEKASYGRQLLNVKASLPHGHFRRWVEDKSGITYSQAQRYMSAAKVQVVA